MNLVTDFEGDRIISYYLTLPIPSWLVFLRSIIYYAINATALGIFVLPIGKLLLGSKFDSSALSISKFLLIFLITNIFYGSFTLWITSRVPNSLKIGNVWMRLVYPLWAFGGFQFSWQVLYNFMPYFAYVNLLNPIMYTMEGIRAAVLGQEGYLPFWSSVSVLIAFSLFFAWHGIRLLKRQLNFI
jgi:ABC-type multidrug transport system permease subunit